MLRFTVNAMGTRYSGAVFCLIYSMDEGSDLLDVREQFVVYRLLRRQDLLETASDWPIKLSAILLYHMACCAT